MFPRAVDRGSGGGLTCGPVCGRRAPSCPSSDQDTMVMKKQLLIALAAFAAVLGSLAFVQAQSNGGSADAQAQTGPPHVNPFEFPHEPHVAVNNIDCMYCHFSAERSKSAGHPSMASCMGCHAYVQGDAQAADINQLREFWDAREPIAWERIYRVADHVYFPHMRHVAAGVECADCHGDVGYEINVVERVQQPLTMGWCLNCHIEQGASLDCTVCHY